MRNTSKIIDRDLGFSRMRKEIGGIKADLEVGFPAEEVPEEIILRAVWNEFGTSTVPARAFIAPTFDSREKQYLARFARQVDWWAKNRAQQGLDRALEILGAEMAKDIKQAILDKERPRNRPSTVRKKGKDDPLVHTYAMHDAVTFKLHR